jgi:hypothetical protein
MHMRIGWAAGINIDTGRGFLADNEGGRFNFDLDPDVLELIAAAIPDLADVQELDPGVDR